MADRFKPPFRKVFSKLTYKQVEEIRQLYYGTNLTQPALARRFGVSAAQIGRVVRGESWGENLTEQELRIEEAEQQADVPLTPEQDAEARAALERLTAKVSPPPPKSINDYASDLASLVEALRKRKAEIQQAEEETRTDDTPDGDNK